MNHPAIRTPNTYLAFYKCKWMMWQFSYLGDKKHDGITVLLAAASFVATCKFYGDLVYLNERIPDHKILLHLTQTKSIYQSMELTNVHNGHPSHVVKWDTFPCHFQQYAAIITLLNARSGRENAKSRNLQQ